MVFYAFDIVAKDKKEFNKKKRLFYYYLKKYNIPPSYMGIKSLIFVDDIEKAHLLEDVFKRVSGIKVVKIFSNNVEFNEY